MLETNTAYPITETNASTLSHISGIPLKTIQANARWTATYSEHRFPRWALVPKSRAMRDGFKLDVETYP